MKGIVTSTVYLSILSTLGLVVGFVFQLVQANRFGAGWEMDAYWAATTIPTVVAAVVSGTLGFVLLPIYVEVEELRSREVAHRFAGTVVVLCLLALVICAILGGLAAQPLTRLVAPGFEAETSALSARLLQILWGDAVLNGLAIVLTVLCQAQRRFLLPAFASVVGGGTMLAVMLLLQSRHGILALPEGVAIGRFVHVLIVSPVLFQLLRSSVLPKLNDPAVRELWRITLPLFASALVYRATPLVDRMTASQLPAGSISHLSYAVGIASVLNMLFSSAIATTIFPSMASHAAKNDLAGLRRTMSLGLRLMMLALFPAIALVVALRLPLVTLVFQHGRFSAADSLGVAALLPWYLLGLIGGGLGNIVGRAFYVLKDTRTVAWIGSGQVAAYAVYTPILAHGLGAIGIAIASLLYFNVSLCITSLVVRRRTAGNGGSLLRGALRMASAAVLAGGGASLVSTLLPLPSPLPLFLAGILGCGIYLGALRAMHGEEMPLLQSLLAQGFASFRSQVLGLQRHTARLPFRGWSVPW